MLEELDSVIEVEELELELPLLEVTLDEGGAREVDELEELLLEDGGMREVKELEELPLLDGGLIDVELEEEFPLLEGAVIEVEELEEVLQAFRQSTFPITSPQTPPASQVGVVQVCPHVNPPTPAAQDVHTVDPPPHCVDTVQTREDEGGVREVEELVLGQYSASFISFPSLSTWMIFPK